MAVKQNLGSIVESIKTTREYFCLHEKFPNTCAANDQMLLKHSAAERESCLNNSSSQPDPNISKEESDSCCPVSNKFCDEEALN